MARPSVRQPAAVHQDLRALVGRHSDETAAWAFKDAAQVAALLYELEYSVFRTSSTDKGIAADLDMWRNMHASGQFHRLFRRGRTEPPTPQVQQATARPQPRATTTKAASTKPLKAKVSKGNASKAKALKVKTPKTARPQPKTPLPKIERPAHRARPVQQVVHPSDAEKELEREFRTLLAEARSLRARAKSLTLSTEVRKLDEQRDATRRRIAKFRSRWSQSPNLAPDAREKSARLERIIAEARWKAPKKGHAGWVTSAGLPSLSRRN